jgi:hypothetical protein
LDADNPDRINDAPNGTNPKQILAKTDETPVWNRKYQHDEIDNEIG